MERDSGSIDVILQFEVAMPEDMREDMKDVNSQMVIPWFFM